MGLWVKFVGVVLAELALVLALTAVDPFAIRKHSDSATLSAVLASLAPFEAINRVPKATVILVTDEGVRGSDLSTPPDHGYYIRFLDLIHAYRPAAVVLDFDFPQPRGYTQRLALRIEQYNRRAPFPVIVPAPGPADRAQCERDRDLFTLVAPLNDLTGRGIIQAHPKTDGITLHLMEDGVCDGQPRPALALAAYREWLAFHDRAPPPADAMPPVIIPSWTYGRPPQTGLGGAACPDQPTTVRGAFTLFRDIALRHSSLPWSQDPDILCLPHPWAADADVLSKFDEDTLREWIEGKVVFIGGHMAGIHDVAKHPVVGDMPGVFFHATAFETLVDKAEMALRPWGSWNGLPLDTLLEVSVLFLILVANEAFRRREQPPPHSTTGGALARNISAALWKPALYLLVLGLLILGAVLYTHLVLLHPPLNWFGILGVISIFAFQMVKRRLLAAWTAHHPV